MCKSIHLPDWDLGGVTKFHQNCINDWPTQRRKKGASVYLGSTVWEEDEELEGKG